jgi:nicotinate-nucleotide--dimethylbenzimidazole phosphoribosyltransferase
MQSIHFDTELEVQLQQAVDNKTKPLGALGQLETLAVQIGLIQNSLNPSVSKPQAFVFGADHGVCAEGINPFPQAVTEQMLANFSAGGAAMSVFCRENDIPLNIVNMGIINELARWENVTHAAVAAGTKNMAQTPAMSSTQCDQAIAAGRNQAQLAAKNGHNLLIIGEMGIGNTTSASAILVALSDSTIEEAVGPGTGATEEQQKVKASVIRQSLSRFEERDGLTVLTEVGGFEIAAMVGVLLAAKDLRIPIVVDGFIATAAALIANDIDSSCRSFWIFAHKSSEPAHAKMLKSLSAAPLIDLDLRLGEGTGGALVFPIIKCAVAMLNTMATFGEAGIDEA